MILSLGILNYRVEGSGSRVEGRCALRAAKAFDGVAFKKAARRAAFRPSTLNPSTLDPSFSELTTGIEPVTSPLPRVCSTN
jgi:hypothetical protein